MLKKAEDEEDFWEMYKEKRNDLFKKEIEKEYLVRKDEKASQDALLDRAFSRGVVRTIGGRAGAATLYG